MQPRFTLFDLIALVIAFILLVLLFSSCATQNRCNRKFPPQTHTDSVHTIETYFVPIDTSVIVPADSSSAVYLVECREKVARLMNLVKATPGQNLQEPEVKIVDNYILVKCKSDTINAQLRFWNKHIKEVIKASKVVTVKENFVTGWQWFQIYAFRILAGLALLYVAYRIIKFKFKLPI